MKAYALTVDAEEDLDSIWDYIARDSIERPLIVGLINCSTHSNKSLGIQESDTNEKISRLFLFSFGHWRISHHLQIAK